MGGDIREYRVDALLKPGADQRDVADKVANAMHRLYTSTLRRHPGARLVALPVRLEHSPQLDGLVFSTGVMAFGAGTDDAVDS